MARRKQTRGNCTYCGNDYSKGGMTRHLQTCPARNETIAQESGRKTGVFHVHVQGVWAPDYWMHLEMPGNVKLQDFDQFLRDIWLECCGHLSAFEIDGRRYEVNVVPGFDYWGETPKDMNVKLSNVLSPGLKIDYKYDFGSTTPLEIRVIDKRQGASDKEDPIRILARNNPPDIPCDNCGQRQATRIYVWEDYETLCDECGDESGYDDEGWLPIVNSPRAGECGYVGDYFD